MIDRFIQGIGGAMIDTASKCPLNLDFWKGKTCHFHLDLFKWSIGFSLITIEFKKDADQYIGWAEAAAGIGLVLGPCLGSFLFTYTNYLWTFIIFGLLLLIGTIIVFLLLPSRTNSYEREKEQELNNQIQMRQTRETNQMEYEMEQLLRKEKGAIKYKDFLCNSRCVFTLTACFVMQVITDFFDPILSNRMESEYHLDEKTIGYIFAIPFVIYTAGCYFVTKISESLERRITITISFIICTISLFFTGPSEMLHAPK